MKKRFPSIYFLAFVILVLLTNCSIFGDKDDNDGDDDVLPGPVAIFTVYPQSGATGQLFEFDGSGSHNFGHPDSVLHVRWNWDGDDTWDTPLSPVKVATHIYSVAGSYNVTLGVWNTNTNKKDIGTENIEVSSSGLPTVTTNDVTSISATTAACGGEVTDEGDSPVTSRGVCWDTEEYPTVYNFFTNDGDGPGTFVSSMADLTPGKIHYVRAYAKNDIGVTYGEQKIFETDSAGGIPCPGTPTVTWHEQTYNTVLIGDQCWMRENLNWETGNSWCYGDLQSNCVKYGRLYDWETMMNGEGSSWTVPSGVQGICPDGWHIPSDNEWKILEGTVDGRYHVGDTTWDNSGWRGWWVGYHLKSVEDWIEPGKNKYNFTAKPGGWLTTNGNYGQTADAYFWTSTETHYTGYAYIRNLYTGNPQSNREFHLKEYGLSVRCVKD